MPNNVFKRNYKKSYKKFKRSYKKKNYKKKNAIVTIGKIVGGFGDRYFSKITVNRVGLNMQGDGTNPYNRYSFSCVDIVNSINGVNDVPSGWTTLATVYNQFLVRAVKCTVFVTNLGSTKPYTLFLVPNTSAVTVTALNDIGEYLEYPYIKTKTLNPLGSSSCTQVISNYMTTKKIFGLKEVAGTDFDYCGYTGSSLSTKSYGIPALKWEYILAFRSVDGASIPVSTVMVANVVMEFDIEFFDRLKGY